MPVDSAIVTSSSAMWLASMYSSRMSLAGPVDGCVRREEEAVGEEKGDVDKGCLADAADREARKAKASKGDE